MDGNHTNATYEQELVVDQKYFTQCTYNNHHFVHSRGNIKSHTHILRKWVEKGTMRELGKDKWLVHYINWLNFTNIISWIYKTDWNTFFVCRKYVTFIRKNALKT